MIRLASEHRTLLGVVALLLLALAGTAGLRQWQVERVAGAVERRQARAVEEALDAIEREFAGLQRAMRARARSLAASEALAEGLRRHALGDAAGREALLRHVAALDLPPQWAVEVYDAALEVLVWNGFSMPLDAAPARSRFFDGVQTAVAEDTDWRRAVALWLPVSDGARPLGAVRVLRLVHVRRPVQNQYLEDYRLADQWRRRVGLPVEVDFQPSLAGAAPARATVLRGIDGTVLGRAAVVPPPPEALVDAVRARHDDVLAFWTTLLLLTLVAALWRGYRRRPAASRLAVVAGAWVGTRFALLALGVPGRWQGGKAPLAPLFDPSHLASTFGGGVMRSTGDLLISAAFLLALAFAVLGFAARRRPRWPGVWHEARRSRRRLAGFAARLGLVTVAVALLTLLPAAVARHAILDSTLDFFTREGLFPRPLVLIVYCALLLTTLAVLVLAVASAWLAFARWGRGEKPAMPVAGWAAALAAAAAVALPSILLYAAGLGRVLPLTMALAFVAVGLGVAAGAVRQRGRALEWLT
ncbi:MAG: hypothetical protein R3247_13910, partial [Rhodothermales bacterium]|nr:hypothetical protein [Rhodothermales bacterium]